MEARKHEVKCERKEGENTRDFRAEFPQFTLAHRDHISQRRLRRHCAEYVLWTRDCCHVGHNGRFDELHGGCCYSEKVGIDKS